KDLAREYGVRKQDLRCLRAALDGTDTLLKRLLARDEGGPLRAGPPLGGSEIGDAGRDLAERRGRLLVGGPQAGPVVVAAGRGVLKLLVLPQSQPGTGLRLVEGLCQA